MMTVPTALLIKFNQSHMAHSAHAGTECSDTT